MANKAVRPETDATMDELHMLEYTLHHYPDPTRFFIRLKYGGIIDHRPPGLTSDILGYGVTFEQAAKNALAKRAERLKR